MTPSILSSTRARQLLATLPRTGQSTTVGPFPDGTGRLNRLTLSARRLTRRGGLSGGVGVEATLTRPTYGGWGYRALRRLRPGWTAAQFLRAASACWHDAWHRAHLESYRENVYDAFQPYESDQPMLDAAEAESESVPHTTIYDEMTVDDCVYWLAWIARKTGTHTAFCKAAAEGMIRPGPADCWCRREVAHA